MARYFRLLKHEYDTDTGVTVIRSQRVYVKNSDINIQLSPITPLLEARLITTQAKIEKFPDKNRALITFVKNSDNQTGYSRLTMNLPYSPNNPDLRNHIKEILTYNGVICGDYIGETRNG